MNQENLRQEIIAILRKSARMSNAAIADQIGASEADVAATIAAMEREGVILGYHALVNEEKWNDGEVKAMIELEIQPERDGGYDAVAASICRFPEVRTVYLISGQRDLRLEVVGEPGRDEGDVEDVVAVLVLEEGEDDLVAVPLPGDDRARLEDDVDRLLEDPARLERRRAPSSGSPGSLSRGRRAEARRPSSRRRTRRAGDPGPSGTPSRAPGSASSGGRRSTGRASRDRRPSRAPPSRRSRTPR